MSRGVPARYILVMTRTAALLVAGMLLAASTGCASTAEAVPPTSAPPSPTSSAEPQPTIVAKPAIAFGGSCAAIIDDATLSDLVGASMTSIAEKSERVLAVEVLGGLDCGWHSDSEGYVWLDVIPAAGLDAQVSDAEADSPYCYGGEIPDSRCSFSTVVGGYWLSGIVGVANGSSGSAIDAIDALTTSVADAAAKAAPVPADRPDGMWGVKADCPTFGAGIDTATVLGELFAADMGGRGGEVTPGFIAALEVVGDFPCSWSTPESARWFGSDSCPVRDGRSPGSPHATALHRSRSTVPSKPSPFHWAVGRAPSTPPTASTSPGVRARRHRSGVRRRARRRGDGGGVAVT